jgi:hypothetical protein
MLILLFVIVLQHVNGAERLMIPAMTHGLLEGLNAYKLGTHHSGST